jgi:uncharacterized protein
MPEGRGGVDPLPVNERIATLDIVRGFALLGMLIANMPGFSSSFFAVANGSDMWPSELDRFVATVHDVLFADKINSVFSLLFGISFTIQLGRLLEREPDRALAIYTRRLLTLLAFGLVHTIVFWNGDVLHIYALLGFGLLLLRNVSDRVVYTLIGASLLYPAASGTLRAFVLTPDVLATQLLQMQAWETSNNLAFGEGSFLAALLEHAREAAYFYTDPFMLWGALGFYVQIATTMLIGFLVGRNGWVRRIPELMPWVKRVQWWALAAGGVCSLIFGILGQLDHPPAPSLAKVVVGTAYVLSRLGMAVFYVLTIVRVAQVPVWQERLAPMAAAGRMTLTNYLMQTLIATTIFYGWGFGLWNKVGPAAELLLAFAIFFIIQVPLSLWWLRRFQYGPVEWLWRLATYGHRPAMSSGTNAMAPPSKT